MWTDIWDKSCKGGARLPGFGGYGPIELGGRLSLIAGPLLLLNNLRSL